MPVSDYAGDGDFFLSKYKRDFFVNQVSCHREDIIHVLRMHVEARGKIGSGGVK